LVATYVAPRSVFLKEQTICYKMVTTLPLGLANHQESRFKVKTYVGEKTSFLKDLAVRVG